ncbi:MAG: TonB-dependent receptor [Crocinitomicaceae bacterium]|nr:TonB-dependent receptor [Crocinitomicaceae bacterium]MDG1776231.1 TonB-dependent receptor [Crocinitomicaceae bacterium]
MIRYSLILLIGVVSLGLRAQSISGTVQDELSRTIPSVKIQNLRNKKYTRADLDGKFKIAAQLNDRILFIINGYLTTELVVSSLDLATENRRVTLKMNIQEIAETNVISKRLADFDVGFLPPIKGVQIYTGTNAVIELSKLNGAKSSANPREIFAKIPGLNIWESDGSGIQLGIGGRGLSPNRAANFNTRQNGYDISADALGYPESYYTPPLEALKSIEIIRGSASLQFGTQFGGLLNFIIREAPTSTPFELTTRNTIGLYNYSATFNRITGTQNRFFYQVYHQYKRGDGYRDNSKFNQQQLFTQLGYHLTDKAKIKLEYTHMDYLAKQAGGLTDLQFKEDPTQSVRDRNWFNVNWNILALHYDHEIGKKSQLNIRAFGMLSQRQSLGFLGKITQADHNGVREMIAGKFQNAGVEARYLKKYTLQKDTSKSSLKGAFLVGARYYQGNSTANQGLASSGNDANFNFQNETDLEASAFSYPSENLAFFAENILFLGKKWKLNFGGRFEYIKSSSKGYYKEYVIHPLNQDTLAIFSINDDNTTKRVVPLFGAGTAYKIAKRSTVYSNFTQNYRAINFTDIRINNPNITIDSLINDEHGYTIETGFRGLLNNFIIYDLAGFYIFYGDKIGLASKPGTIQKERTNIGNAQNFGVELFTEIDFLKAFNDSTEHFLSLFINAAYIDANYITSKEANYIGKKVEYVSSRILKSGIKYRFKGMSFQIQGSYNSSQFSDASNSITPSGDAVIGLIPAYFVMDFSARYAFKKHFQLELGVTNLTNSSYFTRRATGYPGPGILPSDGIGGYLTLHYKFSAK